MKKLFLGLFLFLASFTLWAVNSTDYEIRPLADIFLKPLSKTKTDQNFHLLSEKEMRFEDAAGGQYIGLKSPATVASSLTYTLPGSFGTAGQVLQDTNGAGLLGWVSSVLNIGTINSQTKSANGAVISGSNLVLQEADATNNGLISTGAQTIPGNKTFTGTTNLSTLTASLPVQTDASKNLVSSAIDLSTSQATGVAPIPRGGTNSSTALNNNRVMISSGGAIVEQSALTASAPMRTDASGLPTTGNISLATEVSSVLGPTNGGTNQSNYTTGDLLYSDAANSLAKRGIGTAGQVLTVVGGVPDWATAGASGVTTIGTINSQTKSANGAVISGSNLVLQEADATNNGLISTGAQTIPGNKTFTGTTNLSTLTASLPVQTDASKNLVSSAIDLSTSQATGVAPIARGATGFNTYTTGDLIYSNASNSLAKRSIGTTGQVLTVVGGVPDWATATGGSGGGLDSVYTENFEGSVVAASLTSGNNATVLGGGSLAGTLADDTTTPLDKTKSIKFTQAAGSLNDYFCSPVITLYRKPRNNYLGLNFYYKYDGATNDVASIVYDVTNSQTLTSNLDLLKAATESTRYSTAVFIPSTTSQIRWCFQVKVLNSGKILTFDDVEFSLDPFKYKNLTDTQYLEYSAAQSTFQDRTSEVRFPSGLTTASLSGAAILKVEDDSGNTRTKFTAIKNCNVSVSWAAQGTGTLALYKNGTQNISDVTSGVYGAPSSSFNLLSGEYITVGSAGAGSINNDGTIAYFNIVATAQAENLVTPQIGAENSITLYGQNGYGSTATKIRRYTTTRNNLGSAVSCPDSSTNGTICTINIAGNYTITTSETVSSISTIGISINTADVTSNLSSRPESEVLAKETSASAGYSQSASWTGYLNKGDLIRPHNNGDASTYASFSITREGYKALSAVPIPESCYFKDIKTSANDGGTCTSGSYQTRNLNVVNTDGGTTNGVCPFATLSSNQITLAQGEYTLEASAPAFKVSGHKAKIYNVTDSIDQILGTAENSDTADTSQTLSLIIGKFSITSTKVYELRHRCSSTRATNGFGVSAGYGDSEVFSQIKITKLR